MAHISIQNLTVEFKVYGTDSRSLKKQILSQATGGRIASTLHDTITVKAIDQVSLEINDGDRVGLVGHNGAGKTTLLRAIAGIYKPTGGAIEIVGSVGVLIDPAAGMDFESTGRENIYLRGYVLGMTRREIDAKIVEISEFTGLGDFLELPVKTYSAGMFSRLGVGISLAIQSEILLVDEGIGVADAEFMKKLDSVVSQFFEKSNILVFSSHDMNFLQRYCNKCISFSHGKVEKIQDLIRPSELESEHPSACS